MNLPAHGMRAKPLSHSLGQPSAGRKPATRPKDRYINVSHIPVEQANDRAERTLQAAEPSAGPPANDAARVCTHEKRPQRPC